MGTRKKLLRLISYLRIFIFVLSLFFLQLNLIETLQWHHIYCGIQAVIMLFLIYSVKNSAIPALLFIFTDLIASYYLIFFQVEQAGVIQISNFMLIPITSFFLAGVKGGLFVSILSFTGFFMPLYIMGFNPRIFGAYGYQFLMIYIIEVVLCYAYEYWRTAAVDKSHDTDHIDDLTQLRTRTGFLTALETAVRKRRPFSLMLMDLNQFSQINAYLGSKCSDEILVNIARCLEQVQDIEYLSRYSTDKFIWITYKKDLDLLDFKEKIREQFRELADFLDIHIELKTSIGVCNYIKGRGDKASDLLKKSKLALKEAKKKSRNRIHLFSSSDFKKSQKEFFLYQDLKTSLEHEELDVYFQPKISLCRKEVCGMEALARWKHKDLGFIEPSDFIQLAEKYDLIMPLGNLVIKKSLEHFQKCLSLGFDQITLSLNVSPRQLLQKNFIAEFRAMVDKYHIPCNNIYLEITENVLVQGQMKSVLDELSQYNLNLSLDDFGTGYSSMNYLNQFQFNELKIDKCFTDGILRSPREHHILFSILELSKGLGIKTVVEGVEEMEQLKLLSSLGAQEIQGWVFSRALSSEEFLRYIKEFRFPEWKVQEKFSEALI